VGGGRNHFRLFRYPESAPPFLQRAFDRYGRDFAAALGVARIAPCDSYDIEPVISQQWWDDGAWHPPELREVTRTETRSTARKAKGRLRGPSRIGRYV
jgi:hypothetical protein